MHVHSPEPRHSPLVEPLAGALAGRLAMGEAGSAALLMVVGQGARKRALLDPVTAREKE
jgi:hypothetical protein